MALNHPDRLLPPDERTRGIARTIYDSIKDLPIISPHGHCEASWFADNLPFANPSDLLITPDHYLLRMLCSHGISHGQMGRKRLDGGFSEGDPRAVWRLFAENYHLFAGTPSRYWLDHTFEHLFGLEEPLSMGTAYSHYDHICGCLEQDDYLPRAIFDRFNIEFLATTESAVASLADHQKIAKSDWQGRVVTTYRPDAVTDPDFEGFDENLQMFSMLTGCEVATWGGYLEAHRTRRADFCAQGATATDHGFETPETANLQPHECEALYGKIISGDADQKERALFRAQMMTEMARMSLEDGMTMQIHAGSVRNHSDLMFERYGRDAGFDIPRSVDWVAGLKPMLDAVGHEPDLTIIVFTLDESVYGRELAPLAGAYPALKLGPAWWFFDSPDGIKRFREITTETAGFYNTVGFNDDTRAFPSVHARHDMARRVDAGFLAERVADHRLREDEALEIAKDLTVTLPRQAYGLDV